jgi:hypothetical protein
LGDLVRGVYYLVYKQLGLTNTFRYDHFLSKPDLVYNFEKARLGVSYECLNRLGRDHRETALFKRLDQHFGQFNWRELAALLWEFVFWKYL